MSKACRQAPSPADHRTERAHQLFKAINKLPGRSEEEVERDAVLMRAYGRGTDVLIDRESASRLICAIWHHANSKI